MDCEFALPHEPQSIAFCSQSARQCFFVPQFFGNGKRSFSQPESLPHVDSYLLPNGFSELFDDICMKQLGGAVKKSSATCLIWKLAEFSAKFLDLSFHSFSPETLLFELPSQPFETSHPSSSDRTLCHPQNSGNVIVRESGAFQEKKFDQPLTVR
jgi:hypothetical protein